MSFYTSLTGLNAATTELAVTSNNIANSATAGFKRSTASFGDIFATSPLQRAAAVVGQGVALKEVAQEFSQGFVQFSANSLDLAITGDGFFPLQSSDGSRTFTRNGQFMLNEQNQMVNSAGQALLSLPVDSTNKADFSQPPSALAIPRQTVSEFRASTEVELGLNLPSNVAPITATFNPNKPETYHRTTSLTVYGASGSQHLATVYYVKTQAASSENPLNKWQTHVYIDGEKVDPALIQASDSGGDKYFVNKYGEIKTATELETLQKTAANSSEYLVTQGTVYRKFSYDMLSDPIQSTPAALTLKATSPDDVAALSLAGGSNGLDLYTKTPAVAADPAAVPPVVAADLVPYTRSDLRNLVQLSVDGSDFVEIGLEHLAGDVSALELSGQELATELTKVIQERFGDGKKFDVSAYYKSADGTAAPTAVAGANLDITRDLGESTADFMSVPIGAVLAAAVAAGDIVTTGTVDNPMIMPEELAIAMNKFFAGDYAGIAGVTYDATTGFPEGTGGRDYGDLQVEFDFARQGLRITQTGDDTIHFSTDAALTGELFGAVALDSPADAAARATALGTISALASADGDKAVVLTSAMVPSGNLVAETRNQRFGIEVNFTDGAFVFSSGTTGDGSSIAIRNVETSDAAGALTADAIGKKLFGLDIEVGTPESENTLSVAEALSAVANRPAVRGQASTPAMVIGNQMGIDPSKPFEVTEDNRSLTVIVDNISSQILLKTGQYSVGDFTTELEDKINLMADKLGRQVSGVQVEFDAETSSLKFTGSTATDDSFLQVAGSADFGLEDVEPAFGTTSTYIRLSPDTQGTTPLYAYQDRQGEWLETTDKGTFDENDIPNWSPIFLDRGELTFDTSGTLVSPVGDSVLKSATIIGNDINVAYSGSTQYNSPFAVLNQSQNGAPEGDLVGVNIGEDGLVVASYSNGSQKSLGKIILANFATPKGLRQVGNSGFTATSQSGEAKLGEPGAAGFGTIRAGATERSNVDLTAELVALITAQRNFQANAKAIETSSTLTQTIINMRG